MVASISLQVGGIPNEDTINRAIENPGIMMVPYENKCTAPDLMQMGEVRDTTKPLFIGSMALL